MGGQRGQASVEWAGCVLLVACVLGMAARVAPAGVETGIAARVTCAIVRRTCPVRARAAARARTAATTVDPVTAAYGAPLAALVRRVSPGLVYERGALAVPVDPRRCRTHVCADAPDRPGAVARSTAGEVPTLFTHVVVRGRATYVQFWEYFPDSTWSGPARALGARRLSGFHRDDWESFQVRVDADGPTTQARASSHHGYTGRRIGPDLNVNQLPPDPAQRALPQSVRRAWIGSTGWLWISRGSHAGHLVRGPRRRERYTPAAAVVLVPLERARLPQRYAIVPPWRKPVYRDPESPLT